jgi:hypothetical protein
MNDLYRINKPGRGKGPQMTRHPAPKRAGCLTRTFGKSIIGIVFVAVKCVKGLLLRNARPHRTNLGADAAIGAAPGLNDEDRNVFLDGLLRTFRSADVTPRAILGYEIRHALLNPPDLMVPGG